MRKRGRRDEEEEITNVGRTKLREGKGSRGRKRREGTGGGAGTQGTGIGQGVGNKVLGRSLSMTLTAPGNLSLRSWHVIKEVCVCKPAGCHPAVRSLPSRQGLPGPRGPASLSLFAGPSQTLEGHRTSTFPPKHPGPSAQEETGQ